MKDGISSSPGSPGRSSIRLSSKSSSISLLGQQRFWRQRQHALHGRGRGQPALVVAFRSRSSSLQEEVANSAEAVRQRRLTGEAAGPKQALLERGARPGRVSSGSSSSRLKPEQQPLVVSSNVASFWRKAAAPAPQKPKATHKASVAVSQAAAIAKQGLEQAAFSPNKALPFIKQAADGSADGLHKPFGLVLASAYVLSTACSLSGVDMGGGWGPAATGAVVGALYVALNRFGMKRFWRVPPAPLNVVVTGGTKGIGKAIAREFLRCGDRVMVSSRTVPAVKRAMAELREEVGVDSWVAGVDCDVSSPASVQRLVDAAASQMGRIDVWVNNAGYSGTYQSFVDATPERVAQVVSTNLLGCLLCTRAAMRVMAQQPGGGHIFNMDGAGADGLPTPQYAAYGATKAGIAHLMGSLTAEAAAARLPVGVHCLSPGMVLTKLLLEGASDSNKEIFNILCEQPETVAAFLVPRARTIAARREAGRYVRYLTLPRAAARFVTAPLRAHRFFDAEGKAVYLPERERIMGQRAKRTERLAKRAARRSRTLALAYSASLAGAYLIMAADTLRRMQP